MDMKRGLLTLCSLHFLGRGFVALILVSVLTMFYNQKEQKVRNNCSAISVPAMTISPDWFMEDPKLEQDDPRLLKYITKYHLEPPSPREYSKKILALVEPSLFGPMIQHIFKGQRNGFFVEAGAFNGIQESPTLLLERDFGWTGMLVEGNSFVLPALRLEFRKAWVADVCLALTPYPQKVQYTHHPGEAVASMIKYAAVGTNPSNTHFTSRNENRKHEFVFAGYVECFPISSLLAALNVTTVDYFSLDVEGAELKVLQNIPFDRVNFKVFSVEHQIVEGGIPALDTFFASKHYERIGWKDNDVFYTQKVLLKSYGVERNLNKS